MAGNTPSNAELAQQIQALTNILVNLANAISAVTQGATPAAAAPSSVGFATSPGLAAVKELIDYMTKHGASLHKQGTKAFGLSLQYEGKSSGHIWKRASRQGKHDGMGKRCAKHPQVHKQGRQDNPPNCQIWPIDAETLQSACENFIQGNGINSSKQATQKNEQMWHCL